MRKLKILKIEKKSCQISAFIHTTCFIHILDLNFKDCTFGVIVTRYFRPKSGRLNKRVYCKPIDRTIELIYILWGVGHFSSTIYFWVMEVTCFWIKKHKYNKKFQQSPESMEKYSSEYNGYKCLIKCI